MLAAARPEGQEGGLGKDVTIRKAVDAAEPKIAAAFRDQPTVEASVRSVLGTTYHYLGEPALAIRQLARALELRAASLGPDHPDTLTTQNNLALAYRDAGRWDRAIPLFERTLAVEAATLGPDHREHPPDPEQPRPGLPGRRPVGPGDPAVRADAGGPDRQARRRPPRHPPHSAQPRDGLPGGRPVGPGDPSVRADAGGPDGPARRRPPDTLLTQNNLAPAYQAVGQVDRAIALLEQTLAARAAKLGADHPSTLSTQNNLALAYQAAGRLDRAIALFERTLAARTAKLGADHPRTLTTRFDLAIAYEARGDPPGPSRCFATSSPRARRRSASITRTSPKLSPPWAGSCWSSGNGARPSLSSGRAWRSGRRNAPTIGPGSMTRACSATACSARRKYAEAEPLLLSGYEGLKAREAKIPADRKDRLIEAGKRVVRLYESWGQPEKAREWRAKLGPSSTEVNSDP